MPIHRPTTMADPLVHPGGDTFHNFVDGILIAAAFLENTRLGIVTALAIIAHEIPQVGDYLILLHLRLAGCGRFFFNSVVQSCDPGWRLARLLRPVFPREVVPHLLGAGGVTPASPAVADLIPGLHRRPELRTPCSGLTDRSRRPFPSPGALPWSASERRRRRSIHPAKGAARPQQAMETESTTPATTLDSVAATRIVT